MKGKVMYLNLFNRTPLIVVVGNGRYDCYGPVTARSKFLSEQLEKLDGVSDTVVDGTYLFNMQRRGLKFYYTLDAIHYPS